MAELQCSKCGEKSDTKFCPSCGYKMFQHQKSKEEIEFMNDLIKKATEILMQDKEGKEGGLFVMVQAMLIEATLNWCSGRSDMSPLEMLIGKRDESNERLKAILETSKLGASRQV